MERRENGGKRENGEKKTNDVVATISSPVSQHATSNLRHNSNERVGGLLYNTPTIRTQKRQKKLT
jgi:hypothetical protein